MERRQAVKTRSGATPPWSPFSVAVMALLLPPGGAILTIWNLRRLEMFSVREAWKLSGAVLGVFAVGMSILLLLSMPAGAKTPILDPDAQVFLGAGVACACYLAQRDAFRRWREAHQTERTGSWLAALGFTFIYNIVSAVAVAPVFALFALLLNVPAGSGGLQ